MSGDPAPPRRPRVLDITAVVVAAALQLVVGYITLTSGLVAPLWALVLLLLIWAGGVVLLVRMARTRGYLTPIVPLGNAAIWVAVISFGDVVLGWSA